MDGIENQVVEMGVQEIEIDLALLGHLVGEGGLNADGREVALPQELDGPSDLVDAFEGVEIDG